MVIRTLTELGQAYNLADSSFTNISEVILIILTFVFEGLKITF